MNVLWFVFGFNSFIKRAVPRTCPCQKGWAELIVERKVDSAIIVHGHACFMLLMVLGELEYCLRIANTETV